MGAKRPRTEFTQALKAIATERGLEPDVVIDTIKQAIAAAYRRDARERGEDLEEWEVEVELDETSGGARVFSYPIGEEEKREDVTPPGFGRIAAQTAKQVIHQKIREAEKDSIMEEFEGRVGGLISGTVLRFDGPNVRVDLGKTEGIMPVEERIPSEHLAPNARLSFLFKEIRETLRGKEIILSRSDPKFVEALFAREVPEIGTGTVQVKDVARDPGVRTKIAVYSDQSGVDPVGSCVGQKGVRVQAVTNELGGERVDIVPWTEDEIEYIKASLAPAEGLTVSLKEDIKTAIVKAAEDQLSLAIGKDGQNARLAAALTGWRIEVEDIEGGKKKAKEEVKEDEAEADEVESTEKSAEKKEIPADSPQDDASPSDDPGKTSDDTEEVVEEGAEDTSETNEESAEEKND